MGCSLTDPGACLSDLAGSAASSIADAVLDRVLSNAHRITLEGESLRRQPPAEAKTPRSTKHQSQIDSEKEVKPGDC